MAQDIFEIQTMGDALRNTGYKNIECAMSEIIDNSVQAEAKNVFVIVSELYNERTGRNNIAEVCFLTPCPAAKNRCRNITLSDFFIKCGSS